MCSPSPPRAPAHVGGTTRGTRSVSGVNAFGDEIESKQSVCSFLMERKGYDGGERIGRRGKGRMQRAGRNEMNAHLTARKGTFT